MAYSGPRVRFVSRRMEGAEALLGSGAGIENSLEFIGCDFPDFRRPETALRWLSGPFLGLKPLKDN